jgi:VWFA-related protein
MIRTWSALPVAAVAVFALLPAAAARTPAPADKSVFVSALDQNGKPVTDLTMQEFRLREDGQDREIVSVKAASQPLTVELLADTTESAAEFTQDIRKALVAFVREVHAASADAPISLMEFGQAAVTLVPFSTKTEDLEAQINRLVGKPDADSVLLEALIAASENLAKRPSPRRAIVLLNMEPSRERSQEDPNRIFNALKKSVAQVWAVSLQKGALKNPTRDVVLETLTKNTGGKREYIVGQSALENVLKGYANALTSQYEVTYKRPDGKKPAVQVQIGTLRPGLRLHASGFAPQ